jgi:hypothetical protein
MILVVAVRQGDPPQVNRLAGFIVNIGVVVLPPTTTWAVKMPGVKVQNGRAAGAAVA